eukprot:2850278-Amphidinium_carterae.1
MESRETVLARVAWDIHALRGVDEVWKSDREVVLAAVRANGYALQYATEALRADRDVVLTAVQGIPEGYHLAALDYAADCLLEDPTFAMEAKRNLHLIKLTMLSGRSTVVKSFTNWDVNIVLKQGRRRLGLADDGTRMELWHGSERVPADGTRVQDWPGVKPLGELSEYQLVVTR